MLHEVEKKAKEAYRLNASININKKKIKLKINEKMWSYDYRRRTTHILKKNKCLNLFYCIHIRKKAKELRWSQSLYKLFKQYIYVMKHVPWLDLSTKLFSPQIRARSPAQLLSGHEKNVRE